MRVNVYAEEISDDIEIVKKTTQDGTFTGLRVYLYLPVTVPQRDNSGKIIGNHQYQGKFMHHPDDDDSSAVTFWGKEDMRGTLRKMLEVLDNHYANEEATEPA